MENSTSTSKCDETTKNYSEQINARKKISSALTDCAVLRGGVLTREAKELYVPRLAREPLEDVMMALEKLGELERKEYEPAIPEIGGLLALIQVMGTARRNRAEAEKNKHLVTWECPDCGCTMSGFLPPEALTKGRCQSPYKPKSERTGPHDVSLAPGQICGALMIATVHEKEPAVTA